MKCSVSIVTFQQAGLIGQAVNSALEQQTDFDFEVIVGDDASTDGTRDFLLTLQESAPDKLRLLLADTNYGDYGLSNFMATIDAARGEYVALMDGDDYWTSPDKLQRQVDFMDAHPECAVSAHRVEHLSDDDTRSLSVRQGAGDGLWEIDPLLNVNFTPKSATMIRRSALMHVPEWYRTNRIVSAAWLFNVLIAKGGKVGFIDEVMAVHRVHGQSITAHFGTKRMLMDKLEALDLLAPHFPDRQLAFRRARRRIRWKLRTMYGSPKIYDAMRYGYNMLSSRRK